MKHRYVCKCMMSFRSRKKLDKHLCEFKTIVFHEECRHGELRDEHGTVAGLDRRNKALAGDE